MKSRDRRQQGRPKPTYSTLPTPDGIKVPFGHELARAADGEPLILIRASATVPQRLRAAGLIANTIAEQIEQTIAAATDETTLIKSALARMRRDLVAIADEIDRSMLDVVGRRPAGMHGTALRDLHTKLEAQTKRIREIAT